MQMFYLHFIFMYMIKSYSLLSSQMAMSIYHRSLGEGDYEANEGKILTLSPSRDWAEKGSLKLDFTVLTL